MLGTSHWARADKNVSRVPAQQSVWNESSWIEHRACTQQVELPIDWKLETLPLKHERNTYGNVITPSSPGQVKVGSLPPAPDYHHSTYPRLSCTSCRRKSGDSWLTSLCVYMKERYERAGCMYVCVWGSSPTLTPLCASVTSMTKPRSVLSVVQDLFTQLFLPKNIRWLIFEIGSSSGGSYKMSWRRSLPSVLSVLNNDFLWIWWW